ncbi:MAG: GNAT family N-acetyltransferase [Bacteroidetes bacterium]|jgi:diamine N-acetyltransferase|nr:MAG: GNAT family N-acetyltransferase [Bacteroidota bacterium]
MQQIRIVALDRFNWELALALRLRPEQEAFVPSVLYSLAQAKFEQLHPYGIFSDQEMVGFLMYGEFSGICWINRILVDHRFQGKGVAREALSQLMSALKKRLACREIRTSYAVENKVAERLFASMGFEPVGDSSGEERIVRYEGR